MNVSGTVASISQARTPCDSSNNCAPIHRVIQKSASAAIALGRRIAVRSRRAPHRKPLHPVKQDGLVDVGKAVEQRHHPVARVQHLARELGVVRLIRIHQRGRAQFPEENDPADAGPCWRSGAVVESRSRSVLQRKSQVISFLVDILRK